MLGTMTFDLILLDLTLPDSSGMKTVHRVRQAAKQIPIVILTGMEAEKIALDTLRSGVQDYLTKDSNSEIILRTLLYTLERHSTQEKLRAAESALQETRLHLVKAEKMEAIGHLAYGVAHEIKNPSFDYSDGP